MIPKDSPATSTSLLSSLRARTASAHRTLDGALDFSPLALTAERYTAFLVGTWLVVHTLEPTLDALLGDAGLPPLARSRRATLEADLHALHAIPTASLVVPLPKTKAAAWGAAYVLEGSSLGGVVLAKRVREILGASVADGATGYLCLRGEGTKSAWSAFQTALASFDAHASAAEREECVAMAMAIFEVYTRAFQRSGALAVTPVRAEALS